MAKRAAQISTSLRKAPIRKEPGESPAGFATREDGPALIEVHVAGVCVRPSINGRWEVLAAKRTAQRALFPNKWECGGGMVRPGETFEAAVRRQIFEEFGLRVDPLRVLETYSIHVPDRQALIPGVRFLCQAHDGRVHLNRREFSSYRWLRLPVEEAIDWISGINNILKQVASLLATDEEPQQRKQIGF